MQHATGPGLSGRRRNRAGEQRRTRLRGLIAAGIAALGLAAAADPVQARCAGVALVLAIDVSGSIDAEEFALQQLGYLAAFSAPDVHAAIRAVGSVDVAAVLWADAQFPAQVVGWHRLDDPASAIAFGQSLAGVGRTGWGNTDLGAGLMLALDLLDGTGRCAERRVIDLSGDGRASSFMPGGRRMARPLPVGLPVAKARAEALGVVINALAITTDDAGLADYFRANVMTGSGAFVAEVRGFDTFGSAMADKLVRELMTAGLTPESGPGPAPGG